MIRLAAPYPNIQTISFFPNPEFGDSEALTDKVAVQRTMTGIFHTNVKTSDNRKLLFRLLLDREKGRELEAFINSYFASKIQLTDHLGIIWVGHFTSNPFDFETSTGERQSIQLEFEGCEI